MMLVLWGWRVDEAVGGERMEISSAVPRRNGTRGVSSSATRGREISDEGADEASEVEGREGMAFNLKASIRPGVMLILHSSE